MAAYTTVAEVRAMDGLEDQAVFDDASLTDAIDFAEELIDRYTGTTWTFQAFTSTVTGRGRRSIQLLDDEGRPILYPRTLTSVTVDGTVVADTSAWVLAPEGLVIRNTGTFPLPTTARNVVVVGTAGATSAAPKDIAWSARTIARQHLLDHYSRIPDRGLQIQNDFGTVQLAQASTHPDRPTSLPEVNARLARRRQIPTSLPL